MKRSLCSVAAGIPTAVPSVPKTTRFICSEESFANTYCVMPLKKRALLHLTGQDTRKFVQGIVTNDVFKDEPQFGVFLNPKGRFLYNFISMPPRTLGIEDESGLVFDCLQDDVDGLLEHLKKFKLRAKVNFDNLSEKYNVWVATGDQNMLERIREKNIDGSSPCFFDPRVPELGLRFMLKSQEIPLFLPDNFLAQGGDDFFDQLRISLGVPEEEMVNGKTVPLDANVIWLNGVSFDKGCYVGQELIARTHYKGQIRKRMVPFTIASSGGVKQRKRPERNEFVGFGDLDPSLSSESGEYPKTGSVLMDPNGKKVGSILGLCRNQGIAMIRMETLDSLKSGAIEAVNVDGIQIRPEIPFWWPETYS